jgi:hypothetical protein
LQVAHCIPAKQPKAMFKKKKKQLHASLFECECDYGKEIKKTVGRPDGISRDC